MPAGVQEAGEGRTVPQVVFIIDDSVTNLAKPKSATLIVLYSEL